MTAPTSVDGEFAQQTRVRMTELPKELGYGPHSPEVRQPDTGLELNRDASNLEVVAVYNPFHMHEEGGYSSQQDLQEKSKSKEVLGLKRRTFWFLIVLAMVVVAAAVGGGVGGSLALRNAQQTPPAATSQEPTHSLEPRISSLPTPTGTSLPSGSLSTLLQIATYIPPQPTLVSSISVECPESFIANSWNRDANFRCTNSTDLRDGDIGGITAYSLRSCIDACATMNKVWGRTMCIAISVGSQLSQQYTANTGANCWLKGNGTRPVEDITFSAARLCATPDCANIVEHAD